MRRWHGLIALAPWLCWAGGCGSQARAMRQAVQSPRPGSPIGGVAIVYSDRYTIRLGGVERVHPFPIYKYDQAYRKLVREALIRPDQVFVPPPLTQQQLRLVHTEQYAAFMQTREGVAKILRSPGINLVPRRYVSEGIVDAFLASSGGTVMAGRLALEYGIAFNLGGGYNHASADAGHGFSMIADVPIAIRQLQADGRIKRAMIVDLDCHQGNGPAQVFPPGCPDVYVFDMFCEKVNPQPKVDEHYAVPLPNHLDNERYLKVLADHLPRAMAEARPDIVFYVAGTDVHFSDLIGKEKMTIDGIVRRDLYVVEQARRKGLPVAIVTGGGYSVASWQCIYRTARALLEKYGPASRGGGGGMTNDK